ncbi:hypothetical protein [Rhodovastum atsumiense]|uniref:Uncharacterized protein n=1 Tax=Rhodovastum atsumiense TaxID=504468 RepID=A0A5M6IIT0_9PROT|nr:hypothetical protein [Rhodovastum atsumiense]KAA5608160.1 hypothetical protein F1189_30400 [Rhodovastum atsumiense]
MTREWQYQVRLDLGEALAEAARRDPANPALRPLMEVLARHKARLVCQYDAFAEYVAEAEKNGPENFPLYRWTKLTIDDPDKMKKYLGSFVIHVAGHEVYGRAAADALEAELLPLVDDHAVTRVYKQDTNPANTVPVPAHLR